MKILRPESSNGLKVSNETMSDFLNEADEFIPPVIKKKPQGAAQLGATKLEKSYSDDIIVQAYDDLGMDLAIMPHDLSPNIRSKVFNYIKNNKKKLQDQAENSKFGQRDVDEWAQFE